MTATTLKLICNPHSQLSIDDQCGPVIRKHLTQAEVVDIRSPHISLGMAQDVHIFGRSFVYTKEKQHVFHCQSYQNHNSWNLAESLETFIDNRTSPLFSEYLGEECIFLGGMNIEQTPNGPSHLLPGAANFGHFIFEYLNRMPIFDLAGLLDRNLPMVVYDCLPGRYIKWLQLLGVRKFLHVPVMNGPAYKKVWVSSSPHYRGTDGKFRFWGEGLHWLRFQLFKAIGGPKTDARRRIYLGREDAAWRKPVNESEIKALLESYGFEFPQMHKLEPREQLEIISGAEIVVAAAGANTILTHFAPQHCINILMYPQDIGTGPWGGLGASVFLRQTFERMDCELINQPGVFLANSMGNNERADFRVDLAILKTKVENAIEIQESNLTHDTRQL